MKRILIMLAVCAAMLTGCQVKAAEKPDEAKNGTPAPAVEIYEIKEKLFLTQINDIYLNLDDFLGRTIKYEGMFEHYEAWDGLTYYLVYRNSPGCCGPDGQAGFEVVWAEGFEGVFPEDNDWVEVVGILEEYDDNGYAYLRLALSSLTKLSTRGAEYVER